MKPFEGHNVTWGAWSGFCISAVACLGLLLTPATASVGSLFSCTGLAGFVIVAITGFILAVIVGASEMREKKSKHILDFRVSYFMGFLVGFMTWHFVCFVWVPFLFIQNGY